MWLSVKSFCLELSYKKEFLFAYRNDATFPRAETRKKNDAERSGRRVISYVIEKIHRQWPRYGGHRFLATTFRARPDLALHFFLLLSCIVKIIMRTIACRYLDLLPESTDQYWRAVEKETDESNLINRITWVRCIHYTCPEGNNRW